MCLNEPGFGGDAFHVIEDWIEALDVADLKNQIFGLRQFDQFSGLARVFGHWFFDQYMFASIEKFASDIEMRVRRGDNAKSLACAGGLRYGREDRDTMFFRDFLRSREMGIMNADKVNGSALRVGQIGINAGMLFAERAGSDHADFQRFRHLKQV